MTVTIEEEEKPLFAFDYKKLAKEVVRFSLNLDAPGDFKSIKEDLEGNFNPDTGEVMLGDIMISVPKVVQQAREYGHTEKREFAFLIVHSVLHLLGYDHMTPFDAAFMENKQEAILKEMNILR